MPSMVYIETDKGFGSGFIVSENDDILTNYHVIKDAECITVTPYGCEPVEGLVKDVDTDRDMALLKANEIRSESFGRMSIKYHLKISSSIPRIGETVIAIGNPEGYQGTVSSGIVSAIRDGKNNNLWIQFTAPVSHGSSGGALINLHGEVVGMPTLGHMINNAQNLNFAIAPTVLNQFLNSSLNKPARSLTQPRHSSNTPKETKVSEISLPTAKGFLVHKWDGSVESIRRYVSSPLIDIGNFGILFSTYRHFKAFRSKIDVIVYYGFLGSKKKLDRICFVVQDNRSKLLLEGEIIRELSKLYNKNPDRQYNYSGKLNYVWHIPSLRISLFYTDNGELAISFSPSY